MDMSIKRVHIYIFYVRVICIWVWFGHEKIDQLRIGFVEPSF